MTLTIIEDPDMSMTLLERAFPHMFVKENQSDKVKNLKSQRVQVDEGFSSFWTQKIVDAYLKRQWVQMKH